MPGFGTILLGAAPAPSAGGAVDLTAVLDAIAALPRADDIADSVRNKLPEIENLDAPVSGVGAAITPADPHAIAEAVVELQQATQEYSLPGVSGVTPAQLDVRRHDLTPGHVDVELDGNGAIVRQSNVLLGAAVAPVEG